MHLCHTRVACVSLLSLGCIRVARVALVSGTRLVRQTTYVKNRFIDLSVTMYIEEAFDLLNQNFLFFLFKKKKKKKKMGFGNNFVSWIEIVI